MAASNPVKQDQTTSGTVNILVVGTADTKAGELDLLRTEIESSGHGCVLMNVGVLGDPPINVDITRDDVLHRADSTLDEVVALGGENEAMQVMAVGATAIARELVDEGRVQGVLVIGGTMGTDLALDVTAALPFGAAKTILSTIAFSPLIPADRIASDVMMMLWSGGLWGRNSVSDTILRQAAGATIGAALRNAQAASARPSIGVSSLGTSALNYIPRLWDELDARGYDVVVFHTVGPGGRALEEMTRHGRLAAVLDLSLIEVSNYALGSIVHSGASRLEAAGRHGVPQIVAPGGIDELDAATWGEISPDRAETFYVHNRLIGCSATRPDDKVRVAQAIAEKVNATESPTALIVPAQGVSEWSRPGEPLQDDEGMRAFVAEMSRLVGPNVDYQVLDAHINDPEFVDAVLKKFDEWVADGTIAPAADRVGASR